LKTLVLTFGFGKAPQWAVVAKIKQLSEWLNKHKTELGVDNFLLFQGTTDTKIFWLEGDINDIKDIKSLNDIRDKLKPVLCAIINLDCKGDNPQCQEALKQLLKKK